MNLDMAAANSGVPSTRQTTAVELDDMVRLKASKCFIPQ